MSYIKVKNDIINSKSILLKNHNPIQEIEHIEEMSESSEIKIQKLSNNLFTHIIHLSDLHIRPNDRHNEYKHVFAKLYESINKIKKSGIKAIIIITGDIFDNVNRFLPEQYELCNELFTTLSSIYPLLIINGNHDMKDISRLDSITPSAYGRPNFYYLLKSGAYEYGNVVFSLTSLYDNHPFITRNQIKTNKTCIALYHGTLDGSINDDGFIFKNEESNSRFRKKSDFDNYDAVLLGDIHKMQSLSSTIWYSGSLIQQNYGETLRNHGFLLWDIYNKTNINVSFNEICSEYGMITIKIENNVWVNDTIDIPKKAYIRCIIVNTLDSKRDDIIKYIISKNNIEVIDIIYLNGDTTMCNNTQIINESVHSDDIILKELKLIQNNENIIKIHNEYMSKIDKKPNLNIGYFWYPLTLKYKNLFGYGGDHENIINFKQGITSIIASNATGKTSIINILLFTIFGSLLYGKPQNVDILNNKENTGCATLSIQYGTTVYTINKSLTRQLKNALNPVVIKIELIYIENDKPISLHGTNATEKLVQLFGTIDDFHKCNVLNNRDQNNDFFGSTDGQKIEYLKQVFRLNYFDDLLKVNKNDIESLNKETNIRFGEINILQQELDLLTDSNKISIDDMNNEILKLKNSDNEKTIELNELNDEYDKIHKNIILKESHIKNVSDPIKKLEQEVTKMETKYDNFNEVFDVNKLKTEIAIEYNNLDKTIDDNEITLKNKILRLEKDIDLYKNIQKPTLTKNELYKQICQQETKHDQLKKDIIELNINLNQYNCIDAIKINKTKTELTHLIEELQKQYKYVNNETQESIKKKINIIMKELSANGYQKNKIDTIETNIAIRVSLEKELDAIIKEIELLNSKNATYSSDINYNHTNCNFSSKTLNKKIDELQNLIKIQYNIPNKNNIDMIKHQKNLDEYELLEKEINSIQEEIITDEHIDNYIIQMDEICDKEKLLKKEFNDMKTNLFYPLKNILLGIKNNTFNEKKNNLTILNSKRIELLKIISNENNVIDNNNEIDKLININNVIINKNQINIDKINFYRFHLNLLTIKSLEIKKKEIEQKISFDDKKIKCNKLIYDLNNANKILLDLECNEKINRQMNEYIQMKNSITFMENTERLSQKKENFELANNRLLLLKQQYELINNEEKKNLLNSKLVILINNKKINEKIIELNKKMEYELDRQKIIDNKQKINIIKTNEILKNEMLELRDILSKIKNDKELKQSEQQIINIKIIELRDKIIKIKEKSERLNNIKVNTNKIELKLKELNIYGELMKPTKLQSVIIRKELQKLEITMNEILSKYTKYKIEITYKDNKNINIIVLSDGKYLRINCLSAFENLILTTAFKRAIGKHTNSTKSKIYIIDESLENMDENNFIKTLPELIKFIISEYSYVLLVSQRDIAHIHSNEIKIKKVNGISKIS